MLECVARKNAKKRKPIPDKQMFLHVLHVFACSYMIRSFPERTEKLIGSWDKDGKEIGHSRVAKLVSGGARVTRMAKKTKHICDFRF